jgi:lipoate-protein ligase A
MRDTAWSELVCFAGLGPGELSLDGRKLVGLSQRRTRNGIRIQGSLYRAAPTIEMARLLRPPLPDAAVPEAATLEVDAGELATALATALAS